MKDIILHQYPTNIKLPEFGFWDTLKGKKHPIDYFAPDDTMCLYIQKQFVVELEMEILDIKERFGDCIVDKIVSTSEDELIDFVTTYYLRFDDEGVYDAYVRYYGECIFDRYSDEKE